MSTELSTHNSTLDTGEHALWNAEQRSTLSAVPDGFEAPDPKDWEAERDAAQARPELQALSSDDLYRLAYREPDQVDAIRAEVARRERFAPFQRDERTGDTTGESEAELMRWAGANPAKARARRIREQ